MSQDIAADFVPKHRAIYNELHLAITEGKYKIGDRMPSDGSLMMKYKVSRPTVARAMKDLENGGLVSRKAGSGTFVCAPKDAKDIALIGLLIPGLGETEIFEPICGEIARCAQKTGFNLLWGDRGSEDEDEATSAVALCQHYIEQGVSGVFFAPVELAYEMSAVNERITNRLEAAGIAVILLDRDWKPFPQRSNHDLVGIDNFRAGYLQAQHLIDVGCKRILYVAKPFSANTVDMRIAGYREAMRANGFDWSQIEALRIEPDQDAEFQKILNRDPDGIITANDMTAVTILRQLSKHGVSVPDQVCVMGLDDVKYAQLLSVPLSTLHQPCRKIGAAAMQMMINRIESPNEAPRECRIDTELIARESTQRPE